MVANWNIQTAPNFGSDPEIFVTDKGKLLPAWTFLPDKHSPEPAYWDGFQAEFRTLPESCIAFAADQIRYGLERVLKAARKHSPSAKLTLRNVFRISKATLRKECDDHVVLGCDASLNAYFMSGQFVGDSRKLLHRFAGGHVHIAGVAMSDDMQERMNLALPVVKAFDAILGVWAVGAAASFDDPIRRKYYGLAGEYRLPQHGLEYRVLSNFWTAHSMLANVVFNLTRGILNFERAGQMHRWQAHEQEIVGIINSCDVNEARKLLRRNEAVFNEIVDKTFWQSQENRRVLDIGLHGIESVIKDPENFEQNWMLFNPDWQDHSNARGHNWRTASYMLAKGELL